MPDGWCDVLDCPASFLTITLSKVDSKLIFVWKFNGVREGWCTWRGL